MLRSFTHIGLLACLLATFAGCDRKQSPTVVEIRLLDSPGRVLYNTEQMGQAEAERELQYLATERKNQITNTSTGVRIVIISPQGANSRRARDLATYCMGIGLNSIQFQVR
jgi:hypothetical protein